MFVYKHICIHICMYIMCIYITLIMGIFIVELYGKVRDTLDCT